MGLFDGSKIDKAVEKLERVEALLEKIQKIDSKIEQIKQEYVDVKIIAEERYNEMKTAYAEVKTVIKEFNIFSLFEGFDLKKWIAAAASFLGIATASPYVSNVATDIVNTQLGVESVDNTELIQEIKNLKQELAILKAAEKQQVLEQEIK